MNQNSDLVSIVVPIYNVEQYLKTCIDSIISQTYTNLEIVLVDDGSTDSCPKQCDQYAKIDKRIKVIHQKNAGLSAARNSGLQCSNGKYIAFIDSDDVISSEMIEKLYTAIINNSCQVSCCRYVRFTNDKDLSRELDVVRRSYVYSGEEALFSIYCSKIKNIEFTAWNKLYKRELFLNHNIQYPVSRLYEDIFTTYKLLYYSDRVAFINEELYYYRQRSGSIMNQSLTMKRLDALDGHLECLDFYYKKNKSNLLGCELNAFWGLCKYLLNLSKNIVDIEFKTEFQNAIYDKAATAKSKYFKQCNYSVYRKLYYYIKYHHILWRRTK